MNPFRFVWIYTLMTDWWVWLLCCTEHRTDGEQKKKKKQKQEANPRRMRISSIVNTKCSEANAAVVKQRLLCTIHIHESLTTFSQTRNKHIYHVCAISLLNGEVYNRQLQIRCFFSFNFFCTFSLCRFDWSWEWNLCTYDLKSMTPATGLLSLTQL